MLDYRNVEVFSISVSGSVSLRVRKGLAVPRIGMWKVRSSTLTSLITDAISLLKYDTPESVTSQIKSGDPLLGVCEMNSRSGPQPNDLCIMSDTIRWSVCKKLSTARANRKPHTVIFTLCTASVTHNAVGFVYLSHI